MDGQEPALATDMTDGSHRGASTGPLILVAIGSTLGREALSRQLSTLGYGVMTVESGSAALMMLRAERPGLLLLDQDMPGLTGIDLLREMRGSKDTSQLPVIIMTSSADPALVGAALNAGADDHIVTPCAPAALAARIERQLERARESSMLRQAVSALDARLIRRALEIEELHSKLEVLSAEKAALSACLASRDQAESAPPVKTPIKSIAAI